MSRAKLHVGDVFRLPIDADRAGVGQVVATYLKNAYYLALFDVCMPVAELDVDEAITRPVIFMALTFDAKFAAGHWTIVGNRPVRADMPLPAVKEMVGEPDRVDVVDHTGSRRRAATDYERDVLPYRSIVAPVRLEKALRARNNLEPWVDAYDELVPDPRFTTSRLFS